LLAFTRRLIAFRSQHPVFRRRRWFRGRSRNGRGTADIAWFKPDGVEMSEQDWTEWFAKSFAVFLNGHLLGERDDEGRRVRDDSFLLLFNAHLDVVTFTIPELSWGHRWAPVIDTVDAEGFVEGASELEAGTTTERAGLSLLVLRRL
jgi:isoamylase